MKTSTNSIKCEKCNNIFFLQENEIRETVQIEEYSFWRQLLGTGLLCCFFHLTPKMIITRKMPCPGLKCGYVNVIEVVRNKGYYETGPMCCYD